MKLDYILPILLLTLVIPLMISPQSISAVDISDEKYKIIVQFELAGNPNTIRGLYQQEVAGQIDDIFDDMGLNTFEKTGQGAQNNPHGYSAEVHVTSFAPLGTNPIQGDGIYQIYPLVRVTGDMPTLIQEDYNLAKDNALALQRTAIVDWLQTQGAHDVSTYIHFTFGSIEINEGF